MTQQGLPGVAGIVDVRNSLVRGHVLTVDGADAPQAKGVYQLPGVAGEPVSAKLLGRFVSENPEVVVDGTRYVTGHATSPMLRIMAFVPLLLILGSSFVPIALAILCVLVNLYVLRSNQTDARKMLWMSGVFVLAVVVNTFWAVFSAWLLTLR